MKSASVSVFASGVFAWLSICSSGLAVDITFGAASGYSVTGGTVFGNGNLVGQPSGVGVTTWQGSTTAGSDEIRVVSDGSGQCVQTVNLPASTAPFYKFTPSAADLGGAFDPVASVVAYSFKVRFDDAPNTPATTVLRPRFGEDGAGSPVTAFEVFSNGKFNYTDGATAILAKTTSGGGLDFVASTGVYYTVSGLINYATNLYTLYINGVAQTGTSGNVWLGFKSTDGKTPAFTLRELANGTVNFRRISIADIQISLGRRLLPEAAQRADDFVDDIGINTHLGQTTGTNPYANSAAETLIGQLGVRHIRENLGPTSAYSRLGNLYSTYGIRTSLIGRSTIAPSSYLPVLKAYPAIEAMEGLNEPDHPLANYSYNGFTDDKPNNNFSATIAYQNDLYAAVKGDPLTSNVAIVAPSMADAVKARFLAGVPADYLGFHPYAAGYMPSGSALDTTKIPSSKKMGTQPLIATETGYHTATGFAGSPYYVSEATQAKYTGRTLAEFFNRGLPAYFYEFFDEGTDLNDKEQNFGIVRYNLTTKPAYTVIKNLSALLGEAMWSTATKTWTRPAYTPGSLDYTLTGGDTNLHHLVLKKGSGEFYLLLWQEISSYNVATHMDVVNPTVPVTVTLNTSIGQADVYLLDSLTPKASYANPSVLNLNVPDEVMVVKLTPVAPSVPSNGLPVVSVTAAEARASLHPSRQGVWTISRTGSLSAALVVNYTLSGSAINGVDYAALPASVTIPAGAASTTVTLMPIEVANKQGQFSAVLTVQSSPAYNVGSAKSDVIGYPMSSNWVTDFESGGATAWTAQTRSTVAVNGTSVDAGSNALQWTYNDDGVTPWTNEIRLTFPTARDWRQVSKVVIRFAEDAANPSADLSARMFFDMLNNGVKVSSGASVAGFNLTKETGYRTIELNLGAFPRDQVTGIIFYAAGNDLTTGTHVWRIDNITLK